MPPPSYAFPPVMVKSDKTAVEPTILSNVTTLPFWFPLIMVVSLFSPMRAMFFPL